MPRFEDSALAFAAGLDPRSGELPMRRAVVAALDRSGLASAVCCPVGAIIGTLELSEPARAARAEVDRRTDPGLVEVEGAPPTWLLPLVAAGRSLGTLAVAVPDPTEPDRQAAQTFAALVASVLLQANTHRAFESATLEPLAEQLQNSLGTIFGNAGLLEAELDAQAPQQEAVHEIQDAVERCRVALADALDEPAFRDDDDANPRAVLGALLRMLGADLPWTPVLQLDPGVQRARTSVSFGVVQSLFLQLFLAARDGLDREAGHITIRTARIDIAEGSRGEIPAGRYVRTTFVFEGGDLRATLHPLRALDRGGVAADLPLLTAAARAVECGARIEHTARADRARVEVWLPARSDAPPRRARDAGETTVLVVEDESALLRVVARVLEREGYRVFSATGAGEAMAVCERLVPRLDLLLADVSLPLMSGPEIAQRLRRRQPNLQVLYMTASKDRAVSPELRPLLVKPFTSRALAEAVQDLLTGATTNARP